LITYNTQFLAPHAQCECDVINVAVNDLLLQEEIRIPVVYVSVNDKLLSDIEVRLAEEHEHDSGKPLQQKYPKIAGVDQRVDRSRPQKKEMSATSLFSQLQ